MSDIKEWAHEKAGTNTPPKTIPPMLGINDINEMQKTIERKDRIIKVLKERVRQWLKEYNILDEIIEMYKMSENEAKEIIAELKAENVKLKEEITELEEKFLTLNGKSYSYYTTLQEIKTIAEKLMADNLCNNCDGIGLDANCQDTGCPYFQMDKILQKITKAEEE